MLNRLDAAGSSLDDPNWKENSLKSKGLGGTVEGNYQVLRHKPGKKPQYEFNVVDKMDIKEIRASKLPYIVAALEAYDNRAQIDYSKGAISWSATPKDAIARSKDSNFKRLDAGIFSIATVAGNTTFFKFKKN